MIDFAEIAIFFYDELRKLQSDNFISNREKIIALWCLQNDFIIEVTNQEKISFTEYAKLYFIIAKYQISQDIKNNIFRFQKYIYYLRKNKNQSPQTSTIEYYTNAIYEFIFAVTKIKNTTELDINTNKNIKIQENFEFSFDSTSASNNSSFNSPHSIHKNVKTILSKKTINATENYLICINDSGDYIKIILEHNKSEMIKMAWRSATVLFSELALVESVELENNSNSNSNSSSTVLEDLEENVNIKIISHTYQTTQNTSIIIEPDYLIDVTEVADCFISNSEIPLIPILNKFISWKYSSAAFKGNIINSFFDELLENIECDFDTAIKNAVIKKPLSMLLYLKEVEAKSSNINNAPAYTYNQLIKFFRADIYNYFDNLRSIILEHYLNTNNFIEPSFISTNYGLQGRLDLLSIDNFNNISVVELKSGNAPSGYIKANIGINNKHILTLPLWINHYIQIICYNMLLASTINEEFQKSQYKISTSAILYSKPKEPSPIRSVVTNKHAENEIVIMRNWIVAYLHELSIKNINILGTLTKEQINSLPAFSQNKINLLSKKIGELDELLLEYFRHQTAFITKEIFANKIGLYSDNRRRGFSSSWIDSFDEKLHKNTIIADLNLNLERSNFELMHLAFDRCDTNKVDSFRKGDICILKSQHDATDKSITKNNTFGNTSDNSINNSINNNNSSNSNSNSNSSNNSINDNILFELQQVLRGRIMYIDDREIIISLRNKLSQNLFASESTWYLESDYIETTNNYIFNSLGEFVFSDFPNKDYVLGIKQPEFFSSSETIIYKNYINSLVELPEDKKNILYKALSAKNYFLTQGPPGTGKTSYVLRYLSQILHEVTSENVLLLAHTNRAADEICSSLLKISQDFNFIRLGNKDSSAYKTHLLADISLADLYEKINNTRFFVSTVSTAIRNPELFKLKFFGTVIIDEATQILEPHLIGILSKCVKFIMIGDEKQLPAITTVSKKELECTEALKKIELENLQDSLFERLLRLCKKNNWGAFAMLKEQNRMALDIMQLVNNLFYNNNLTSGINTLSYDFVENIHTTKFINTPIEHNTKFNLYEIDIILSLLNKIEKKMGDDFNEKTVGIISPWRLQCSEIYKRLPDKQRRLVTVDTVERFQGSEREIIIYSTATNSKYLLELLTETKEIDGTNTDRKLNVAISRAKQSFIMLGNRDLLITNNIYKQLIKMLEN